MPRDLLGDFEYRVLAALIAVGRDAYGVPLREKLEEVLGRSISVGALYTTLDRLETKGYVRARMGEPTAIRGGRAKKYFELTGAGQLALQRTHAAWAPALPPNFAGGMA